MPSNVLSAALLGSLCFASPTPTVKNVELDRRDLIGDILKDINNLGDKPSGNVVDNLLNDFKLVTATAQPVAITAAASSLSNIVHASPTPSNIVALAGNLVAAGLTTDDVESGLDFVNGLLTGENSFNNFNPRNPTPNAYRSGNKKDAPYSLSEAQLRAAIHIPPTFQYGRYGAPPPVILVPGTGDTGYTTFAGNYIPLLTGSTIGDPVWLNIPEFLLGDIQVNAEYVAYAINYIYGISNHREVAIISWSQGGICAQWATKYWPSTRSRVMDIIAHSPDYKGTILANFLATPGQPVPPSVLQQQATSNFIKTLRAFGGDSAYVPTTTVYSGFFDEIVEPQQGTSASAFILDARNVGVSNTEVQSVCPNQPAGSFYTHEGTLYNPIAYALVADALAHKGPGQISRINKDAICGDYLTPGLDLADFLLTENSILIAGAAILTYPATSNQEPAIKPYALSPPDNSTPTMSTSTTKSSTSKTSSTLVSSTTKSPASKTSSTSLSSTTKSASKSATSTATAKSGTSTSTRKYGSSTTSATPRGYPTSTTQRGYPPPQTSSTIRSYSTPPTYYN